MNRRISIIPADGIVAVNGMSVSGLDLSFLPDDIHAIQWYGERGEVEFRADLYGYKKMNEKIDSFKPFEKAVDLFERMKATAQNESEKEIVSNRQQLFGMVQAILDEKAKSRGYDNIAAACSYLNRTVTRFAAEALAYLEWRDKVWVASHQLLSEIESGAIALPDKAELASLLPSIQWPPI